MPSRFSTAMHLSHATLPCPFLSLFYQPWSVAAGPDLPAFVASLGPGLTRSSLQAWISGKADNPELEARVMCNLAHMQPQELDLYSLRPAEVSYFVASLFTSMPELQQHVSCGLGGVVVSVLGWCCGLRLCLEQRWFFSVHGCWAPDGTVTHNRLWRT